MARPPWGRAGAPRHCCSWCSLGPVRLGSLERCLQREGALSVEVPEEVLPALLPGLRSCHLGDARPEGLRWAGGRAPGTGPACEVPLPARAAVRAASFLAAGHPLLEGDSLALIHPVARV